MLLFFFFFQAEDGIRDIGVTGVQTCALPISRLDPHADVARSAHSRHAGGHREIGRASCRERGVDLGGRRIIKKKKKKRKEQKHNEQYKQQKQNERNKTTQIV